MINYQQAIRARMQEATQEIQAEQEKDLAIRSAKLAAETARQTWERESQGAAAMSQDPRWVYWTFDQRQSVATQWGERVEIARQAQILADQELQQTVSAWTRAQLEQKQASARQAEQAEQDQAQRVYALEQERAAKSQKREAWLASGGLSEQFETAWPSMWQEELVKRAQQSSTPQEKLRATGRYHI